MMIFVAKLIWFFSLALAQVQYQKPEKEITDSVQSAGFSYPFFNHQMNEFVIYRVQTMPSIAYTNRPFLRLAGTRFNPQNLAPVTGSYKVDLRYVEKGSQKEKPISFSKESYLMDLLWSPDGKRLAVTLAAPRCVELWWIEIPSLKKQKFPHLCLNTALGSGGKVQWVDSENLLVLRRSSSQEIVISQAPPQGPVVKESKGVVSQNRTYQDLLKTPQDEEAFYHAIQSKITLLNLKKSQLKDLSGIGSFMSVDLSPNKKWMLVSELKKPFSYAVPFYLFKRERKIVSLHRGVQKSLGVFGPFESVPIQGVITGPRDLQWDLSHPQRFFHVEAQDGGDWKNKVPYRDFLFLNTIEEGSAQIKTEKVVQLQNRFQGLSALEDSAEGYLLYDFDRESNQVGYYRLKKNLSEFDLKEFMRRNEGDDYSNPGTLVTTRNEYGERVARVQKNSEGSFIYWNGNGATVDGDRPFLGKMNLKDMKMIELFRSAKDRYENIWAMLPNEFSRFLVRNESSTQPPRFEIRKLEDASFVKIILEEDNPFKVMAKIKKKILKYKRQDGVEMTGILYYPLDFVEGKKYPAVVHAYPLEYTDSKSAGQTRGTAHNFEIPFRATPLYFALRGYFVLDEAQIPIIGPPDTKNDTFVEQLTADAEATVKALEATGSIDIQRLGVIGHSYGAFMVAHLLTHTKFFAAGIARSGAYNRTLTPFGFQGEKRNLWEAKNTYLKLSPFLDAEKMKFPLLMIHGLEDNNSGTFTMQSERYFEALKGQGANVRLVLLPTESHSYNAQESVLHVLWESFQWFDRYLKMN